jgi:hypothetical protein
VVKATGYRRTIECEFKITNQHHSDGYMFVVELMLNRLYVSKTEGRRECAAMMETRLELETVENSDKRCSFTWRRGFTWLRPNILLPRRAGRKTSNDEERLPIGNVSPPDCVTARVITEIPPAIYADIERIMRSIEFRPRRGVQWH